MKLNLTIIFVLVLISFCFAEELFEIHFYNELKEDFYNFQAFKEFQDSIASDSIETINIFSGKILNSYSGDIFPLAFLNYVNCDLASPSDFLFGIENSNLDFQLLASNISSDTLDILPFKVIETDSLKIGICSIYTPDFAVKNKLSTKAELDPQVFAITKTLVEYLDERCNVVVLISNLTKFVDKRLITDLPVDVVLSSDYQEKADGKLNGNVHYCSVVSSRGKFGKLQISYSKGLIDYNWLETPINLSPKLDEVQNKENPGAGSDR